MARVGRSPAHQHVKTRRLLFRDRRVHRARECAGRLWKCQVGVLGRQLPARRAAQAKCLSAGFLVTRKSGRACGRGRGNQGKAVGELGRREIAGQIARTISGTAAAWPGLPGLAQPAKRTAYVRRTTTANKAERLFIMCLILSLLIFSLSFTLLLIAPACRYHFTAEPRPATWALRSARCLSMLPLVTSTPKSSGTRTLLSPNMRASINRPTSGL